MKIKIINKYIGFMVISFLMVLCFFYYSCKKADPNADPQGTVSTTISKNQVLKVDSTTNPIAYLGYSDTVGVYNFVSGYGLITSVSGVASLAAINSKPATGYSNAAKAVAGYGYVLVFNNGNYCRLYCVSMSGSYATIKYQYPY